MRLLLPKQQILNAKEAETLLYDNGYALLRTKGSHRIYIKADRRIVIPFHGNKTLHPKIVADVFDCIT